MILEILTKDNGLTNPGLSFCHASNGVLRSAVEIFNIWNDANDKKCGDHNAALSWDVTFIQKPLALHNIDIFEQEKVI